MKVYFNFNIEGFTNCYTVVNDDPDVMEAIIIDPGRVTNAMISQIEEDGYKLKAVLITHNHANHVKGLSTLRKIYNADFYAADSEVAGNKTIVLHGEGQLILAGLTLDYMSLPGHTADSLIFRIGNILFTGDTLYAGLIGSTTNQYSERLLCNNIEAKILSQIDNCVIMPGHGPPTTIGSERKCNLDLIGRFN